MDDDKLHVLLIDLQIFLKNYQDVCVKPEGWIHYYFDKFNLKPQQFLYTENLQKFTLKIEKIVDMMIMSHWIVRVINPEKFSVESLNDTVGQRRKLLNNGLRQVTEEEWLLLRDQLKGLQFGVN